MAGKTAVTLRLGVEGDEKIQAALRQIGKTGDDAMQGLSREAKEAARAFDRLEKSVDASARSAAQVARAYVQTNAAVAAGVRTQADAQRVLDMAAEKHKKIAAAANENAKAVGLARHELINLSRQGQDVFVSLAGGQSPLMVFLQQGSQIADIFGSSKAGAGAAVRSFGVNAVKALTSPIGIAIELAAAVGGVAFQASRAQAELAKLGEQSRLTGLPADVLQGAKTVGARAGLDEKGALNAFGAAAKQFQAYGRNEGDVKSVLEGIDKGFLKVLDRARSAGEFIDILNGKIRSLPTAQAEQLARALYQDEGGAKLVDAIQRGEVSMRALLDASGSTGNSLNQSASAADEMQKKIAQAAQEADNKLLNAFKNIKSPTDDIKLGWYGIVGSMAEAVEKSEKLQRTLNAMTSWSALFKEIGAAYDKVDRMLGARPVVRLEDEDRPRLAGPGEIPFPNFNEAKRGFLPKLINSPVGDTRGLFPKGGSKKTGRTPEQVAAENFVHIREELQAKIALASAEGEEYDKANLKLKILNEQHKIGRGAIQAQKDEVAALVMKLDDAERSARDFRDAMKQAADLTRDAISSLANDFRQGKSAGDALNSVLDQMQRKVIDIASRSITDSLFGGSGKDFGGGGLLGGLVGGLFGGGKSTGYFSSSLFSGSPFSFGFADGGVMTSRGPLPLRRYAGGGIADSPQLAMFGEGRMPEAYVPLPDGRSIPVAMRGGASKITINNNAPVDVTPRVMSDGEIILHVEKRIASFGKQLSEAPRRANR
jgi:hypothetical protein